MQCQRSNVISTLKCNEKAKDIRFLDMASRWASIDPPPRMSIDRGLHRYLYPWILYTSLPCIIKYMSNFRAAAHTDPNKQSKSLIQHICYAQSYKFPTAATPWGCEHESVAFTSQWRVSSNFTWRTHSFINRAEPTPRYPDLGASPDGTVSCGCCENGLVEVKCTKYLVSTSEQVFNPDVWRLIQHMCTHARGNIYQKFR